MIDGPGGTVILMRSSDNDVVIEDLTETDRRLLAAIDGNRKLEELEAMFGAGQVSAVLDELGRRHVIEDAADEDEIPASVRRRLDRQLRYFSDVSQGTPTAAASQERLETAEVAILGAGGLGGRVALDLAAIGVGTIRVVDGDVIELSNLNRQIQYAEADIGRPKAVVLEERLLAFNSGVSVDARSERLDSEVGLTEFVDGASFVVNAADWPPYVIERWCNVACFELGIPFISMSQIPPMMRVGPIYAPGRTGCFECTMTGLRRDHPFMDAAIEQRLGADSVAATLSPTSGATASLVAMEILHFITGLVEPPSLGAALTVDTRTMTIGREPVVRDPGCRVCGSIGARPDPCRGDHLGTDGAPLRF